MNVWILSVRELARLLRGLPPGWPPPSPSCPPGGADGVPVRLGRHDAVLYVANPALAGGVLGGLLFALLTLCDCARTSRCRVEVLCDAAVSP